MGLVGCGQIADAHLDAARRTRRATIAAVCDREPDLAQQAARRFAVPALYDDFDRMLADAALDVIHITTPPATHRRLALRALESGVHVYVEKPFALDLQETDEILEAARQARRLVTVGHDRLFDPVWLECSHRLARGDVGDLRHVEILQAYDLAGPFGRLLARDDRHWVHELPGGLFQNTLPHALALVAALIPDEQPAVSAVSWRTPDLDFESELHVLIQGKAVTATVTFLTVTRPVGSVARFHGRKGCLEVDFEARTTRARLGTTLPALLTRLHAPAAQARDAARGFVRNLTDISRGKGHYFAGMHSLVERFYRAIADGERAPFEDAHLRRVAYLMDRIVTARAAAPGRAKPVEPIVETW